MARNSNVSFVHLTRENPTIKRYADDPATAKRWAAKYRGEIVCPHNLRRLANPEDQTTLGTFKEARRALLLIGPPDVNAIACFEGDHLRIFPVEIPQTGKLPEAPSEAPGNSDIPNPSSGSQRRATGQF